MTSALKKFLFIMALLAIVHTPARAGDTFSAEQKSEIEELIKAYVLDNPEVLIESLDLHQAQQAQERDKQAAEALSKNMESIISADSPSAGNPEGDIIVVEFFDYNCGYCKKALGDIQEVVKNEKDVRVIFKEMPILGPSSMTAAQWALAAHKQGKYFEYHAELMKHRGAKDASSLEKLAKKLGLDVKQMKKDAASKEVSEHISKDVSLARQIGINGTPAFIVNDKLFPGYLGEGGLKSSIENARKGSDKKGG